MEEWTKTEEKGGKRQICEDRATCVSDWSSVSKAALERKGVRLILTTAALVKVSSGRHWSACSLTKGTVSMISPLEVAYSSLRMILLSHCDPVALYIYMYRHMFRGNDREGFCDPY